MSRHVIMAAKVAGMILAGAAAWPATSANAQSPVCADLQAQYMSLLSTRSAGGGTGQRMVQMDQLSRELATAQAAARQGNCNRFLFFGPRPHPQCPAINATVRRLQQQIAQMRQQGSLFARSPEQERDQVRAWLNQYGCEVPQVGGLRTLCVRVCDGYYFPISFSASRQRSSMDAEVCQSMYAAAGQAELFSHTTNGDVAEARSVSGARYGDQPYAFLFRQGYFPTCARQLSDGITALGERYWSARIRRTDGKPIAVATATADVRTAFVMPMPTMRPLDRQEDPETIANRNGKLAVAPYVADAEAALATANGIRLIGDPYYAELFDPTKPEIPMPVHRAPLGFDLIGSAMAAEARESGLAPDTSATSEIR